MRNCIRGDYTSPRLIFHLSAAAGNESPSPLAHTLRPLISHSSVQRSIRPPHPHPSLSFFVSAEHLTLETKQHVSASQGARECEHMFDFFFFLFFFSQQAAAWAASEHRETVGEKVGERCGETAENKIKSLHESLKKDTGHVLYMFMSAGAPTFCTSSSQAGVYLPTSQNPYLMALAPKSSGIYQRITSNPRNAVQKSIYLAPPLLIDV